MDIIFAKVTGQTFEQRRDAEGSKRVLQVEATDERDVRAVEWIDQPNQDSPPANDAQVVVLELGGEFDIAMAGDDNVPKTSKGGEFQGYSSVQGVVYARIHTALDGTITIVSQPAGVPGATITLSPAGVITLAAQQIALAPAAGGTVELAGSNKGAAGEGDETIIDGKTAADFFTWAAAVTAATGASPPLDPNLGIKGKINAGSDKVKLS